MADKLEIGVVADTDDAQQGLDDLSKTLEEVGDAAEKAGQSAGKSSSQWETQAETMARVGVSAKPAAAGMKEVATATITASKATAIAQTRFQRFASTLRTFGRTAVRGITSAFSGLVSAMATIGRLAGRALMAGFLLGLGALAAVAIAFLKSLDKIINAAGAAGKEAAQALTDAFSAGLSLEHLTELQGAMSGILPNPEDARAAAQALGELNAQLRIGGEESDRAQAAAKLLGINLQNLTKGGAAAFGELQKLQGVYQTMDQVQQRDLLRLLFPEGSDEVLSQIDAALEGTKEQFAKMGTEAGTAGAKIAAELEKMKQQGEAAAAASKAWENLISVLGETTGFDFSWAAVSAGALRQLTSILNGVSGAVRAMGQAAASAKQSIADFVAQITALASAGWEAIKSGIDTVVGAINALITAAQNALKALRELFAESDATKAGRIIGGMVPRQQVQNIQPRFAGLLAPAGSGGGGGGMMLRAAQASAVQQQSNLMGRAAPRAANDNVSFGPAMSRQLDDILWRWDEVAKKSKAAGEAVAASAAKQTAALTTVAQQMDVFAQASAMSNQQLVDWASNVLQAADPTFAYRAALAQLDEAMRRGIISAGQYKVALQQIQADLGEGGAGSAIQNLTDGLRDFGESAADAFLDAALNGEDFGEVLQGLAKDLAKLIIKTLIIQPLLDSLFSGLSGIGGFGASAGIPLVGGAAAAQSGLARAGASLDTMSSNIMGRRNRAGGFAAAGGDTINNNLGDIAIDMSRTGAVTASTKDAKTLGLMVQRSVEAILVQESRPGGILRRAA